MSRIFDEKHSKLSDRAQSCCWRSAGIICWRCRKKSGKIKIIREETQDGKIGKSFISLKMSVIYYVRFSDENEKELLICKLFSYGLCIIFIFNFRETLSKQQSQSKKIINDKNLNNALMFYVRTRRPLGVNSGYLGLCM